MNNGDGCPILVDKAGGVRQYERKCCLSSAGAGGNGVCMEPDQASFAGKNNMHLPSRELRLQAQAIGPRTMVHACRASGPCPVVQRYDVAV